MKISIAIPVYKMNNWQMFLKRCLYSIKAQTYRDYEVIIADNSDDNEISDFLYKLHDKNPVLFYKNKKKGMAPNTNFAIKQCTGDIVKILYMDDYLSHPTALQVIATGMKGEWLVTGCNHDLDGYVSRKHYASYAEDIATGNNTIGSPSVLAMRKNKALLFDDKMTWLLDCDLYKRLYDKYGDPDILDDINVTIGLHKGQMTNILTDEKKKNESEYMKTKYA